jgi:hypothetical protein
VTGIGETGDQQRARKAKAAHSEPMSTATRTLWARYLVSLATDLVNANWYAIQEVAEQLLKKGKQAALDEKELYQLLIGEVKEWRQRFVMPGLPVHAAYGDNRPAPAANGKKPREAPR